MNARDDEPTLDYGDLLAKNRLIAFEASQPKKAQLYQPSTLAHVIWPDQKLESPHDAAGAEAVLQRLDVTYISRPIGMSGQSRSGYMLAELGGPMCLIERLREQVDLAESEWIHTPETALLFRQAADEIERLQQLIEGAGE